MATATTTATSDATTAPTSSASVGVTGGYAQQDSYWQYSHWPSHPVGYQSTVDPNLPFARWLTSEGVSDVNARILIGNGITCKRTLSMLTPEDMHVLAIQPLGQRKLLEFIMKTAAPEESRTPPQKDQDPVMASLGQLLGQHCNVSDDGESSVSYIPPFAIKGGKKHLDITDYVRCFNTVDERVLAAGDGDMQVLIRGSGSSKPKLDEVSPLAWMGASIRILRTLIGRGDLALKDIDRYLTYMEKLSDLSAKYTWTSLRNYDREFRRWQAQTGVAWTQDNSHLAEAYLYVRQDPVKQPPALRQTGSQGSPRHHRDQQGPICRQFNLGDCRFGSTCRFRHVCLKSHCQQPHAIFNHSSPDPKNGQGQ